MKRFLGGFTLAETMIVIVVLGIIATLTIPALVNKNKESVAKTKVRKAMAAYESALNKMIIENDLKSHETLTAWAGNAENGCTNSTNYFKKVQGDGCIFKTSDGIWWNISDIERPVISFKEINTNNAEEITIKANNESDKTAFVLVGRFGNDGSLRVDDLAYETANSVDDAYGNASKAQIEKLYGLLGLKSSSAGGNQSPFAACNGADTCVVDGIEYKKMTLTEHTEIYCTYNRQTHEENCDNVSTSTAGDYYILIEDIPIDWESDSKLEQNCATSTYEYCSEDGDGWNFIRNRCESLGRRLATIAELKSLANQNELPENSSFWASEEQSSIGAYIVNSNGNIVSDGKSGGTQVLCIGK